MGPYLVITEAAAPEFHHGSLQLALALPIQQLRRQFPIGRHGQCGGDLLPGSTMLLILQLAFKLIFNRVA